MPKLKKWNVHSQRKRRAKSDPIEHNDHSYYKKSDTAEDCLQEEMQTYLYTAEPIIDLPDSGDGQYEDIEYSIAPVDNSHYIHQTSPPTQPTDFDLLKDDLIKRLTAPYILNINSDIIKILEMYPSEENTSIKLIICITREYSAKIFIHRVELDKGHDFWLGLPPLFNATFSILTLLTKLQNYTVCLGNFEHDLTVLIPIGSSVQSAGGAIDCQGYHEGDYGAVKGTVTYASTVRSVNCKLLVQGNRCSPCTKLRRVLISRKHRRQEKEKKTKENMPDYLHSKQSHTNMSRKELMAKLNQQKHQIDTLQTEINRAQRTFQREVVSNGVTLDFCQSLEMKDTMAACTADMEKAFPDANSYQRLFWAEQFKCTNLNNSKGMRWHPTVIRWCLYLRQKSNAAYEALRDSGFVKLPSSRTLFDYSHYTRSGNGFIPEVMEMLKKEAEKKDMYNTENPWKSYVGILFDEIKVKADLVYDKHSGELIGYVHLDKVGNQIVEFENSMKDSKETNDVAKYMLVLMVRGIVTDLKFPLAGFATLSITADFLYPIIWKAVRILETGIPQLKVLFLTCDGASANRKFFNLHGQLNAFTHYTVNPFADDDRKLYFISDVPHLLKTTRNCFSNSYSHKNTRKMWKDGKDISWIHLLNLFEHHCELAMYNPCPKLTRRHVDMSTYGCMKVSLAAQVLSSTVANALEMMYGDNVTETVNFIRMMNRFFDCLNVRNLYEGRNKRNPDLTPYTTLDDERLQWLRNDFIEYFEIWEQSVMQRPGEFTVKQHKGMMLSQQTLTGLKISVFSIVDCTKYMLSIGAKFILTHHFNQDPLEQQFGHYRHRSGDNNNPSVYEVRHMMNQMRAVGAQALAPKRGNIHRDGNGEIEIDNSSLPKRKSY